MSDRCMHLQDPELTSQNLQRLRGCPMTDEERQAFESRLIAVRERELATIRTRRATLRNPRKLAFWFGTLGGGFPRIYGVLFLAGLGYGGYWIARLVTGQR